MQPVITASILLITHASVGRYLGFPLLAHLLSGQFCWWTIPAALTLGAFLFVTLFLGLIFLSITIQPVSRFYTHSSLLIQWVADCVALYTGKAALQKLFAATHRPRGYQEDLLKRWLEDKKDTDYGKKFKFSEMKNLATFREKHPLTDREHYKSFLDTQYFGDPPDFSEIGYMATAISEKVFNMWPTIPKIIRFDGYPRLVGTSEDTMVWSRYLIDFYATPADGFRISTHYEEIYVHLLFGLRDRDVSVILAGCSPFFLYAMQILEEEWQQFMEDLSSGTLSSKLKLDAEVRRNLEEALGNGHPKRAEELIKEFKKGFQGIVRRMWPNLHFIKFIDTPSLEPTLVQSYAKDVIMYSQYFGTNQFIIGLNITPKQEEEEFLLTVTYTVFEFIEEGNLTLANPKTYFIDEVDVGKNYEIVVTTEAGLCRFRSGIVVQITEHFRQCPIVKILYRIEENEDIMAARRALLVQKPTSPFLVEEFFTYWKGSSSLNFCGENLDEDTLVTILRSQVTKRLEARLCYYSAVKSTHLSGSDINLRDYSDEESRPHYIFFLEVVPRKHDTRRELKNLNLSEELDKSLCSKNHVYRYFRKLGQIGDPFVFVVRKGSFGRLYDHFRANSRKMPQILRTSGLVKFMLTQIQDNLQ